MNTKSPYYPVIFLLILTIVCTFALTGVSEITREKRQNIKNTRIALKILLSSKSDYKKLNLNKPSDFFSFCKTEWLDALKIYTYKNEKNEEISSIIFKGSGLWDSITSVISVFPSVNSVEFSNSQIIGLQILEQKETPGLGGRIEEQNFLNQFTGHSILKQLKISPAGQQNEGIDGITGATMTCKYLQENINQTLSLLRKKYISQPLTGDPNGNTN